jgi:hypothetical protein
LVLCHDDLGTGLEEGIEEVRVTELPSSDSPRLQKCSLYGNLLGERVDAGIRNIPHELNGDGPGILTKDIMRTSPFRENEIEGDHKQEASKGEKEPALFRGIHPHGNYVSSS